MKSINAKITMLIIGGLLLQIIMVGSLYRLIIARQILSSVNGHEAARQEILQNTVLALEKNGNNLKRAEQILNQQVKKNDVEYQVKDMDSNVILSSPGYRKTNRDIEEMSFIRFNKKPEYILMLKFPLKLKNIARVNQSRSTRFVTGIVVFGVSALISFLIYKILAVPLKKLKRAMEKVDYGNTLITIPYYGEDELGELCRKFEEMGRRLNKSEENQTELIQAISHDLKTPLTSISGYVQRLLEGKVVSEEKRREYYEIINRKSNDVKALLEELDEYANIKVTGRYEKEELKFKEFYETLCIELQEELSQRGGKLEFQELEENSKNVYADPLKIKRLMGNIIENSLKYAGEGCVIQVNCRSEEKSYLVEICDNGPGVSEGQLERIFDRFYRGDSSRSREKGGTGLGLAICKGIVEAHGGRIWARNRQGGGMCICFTVPMI